MSDDAATIEQIFAMQPEGVVGGDIFPYNDVSDYMQALGYDAASVEGGVDYLDVLEAANAQNEDEFRMKGVTDGPTLGEAEEAFKAAAADLAEWQAMKEFHGAYGQGSTWEGDNADQYFTRQARLQDRLQDTRNTYVALGGDPDPSFLSRLGQGAIDLIGAGGQAFSDIITGGTGPDVAQTLLDPVSMLLGGLGATINYSDSGKTTPLIVGNTTASGMPVGLNIPDPRAIWQDMSNEGLFPWLINNGAGLGGLASAAVAGGNTLDSTNKTGAGVGLSGASLIAAGLDKDSDAVKTTGTGAVLTDTADLKDAPSVKVAGKSDLKDAPSVKVAGKSDLADAPSVKVDSVEDIIKTGLMSDAELDAVLTDIGGGGGTGVTPEQIISQGGMDTVSTEKAGLAYINALYNPALSLAENMALLRGNITEEEDIVDSAIYYGGGMIQNTNMTDEINRLLRRY
jgi:hypothetical protein